MFAEVLICDGCQADKVGWSTSRAALEAEAKRLKWLESGEFVIRWFCPTCRIAIERKSLMPARAK